MQANSRDVRQSMRCGFEPPPSGDHALLDDAWQPPSVDDGQINGYVGPKAEVCVGYTANLPEVLEVSAARMHWSHGQLDAFCDGKPDERFMQLILVLEASSSHAQLWSASNPKGGMSAGPRPNEQVLFHRGEGA